MQKNVLAIASCRVSTPEQIENNSLDRQHENVLEAAKDLGVTIDRYWSGNMSSKHGTNTKRRDIKEMEAYCKKHPRVKYLIVDRPDRFMRSIDEAMYFEVLFREIGVKVWYASDKSLNKDNLGAKIVKFAKYFAAEGSNEERISSAINSHTKAISAGRYPFSPKPGYMGGINSGIPEPHPVRGPALKNALIRIAEHTVTPTEGLIELNKSAYTTSRAPLKMDKFRRIATDAFYAGVIKIDKQIKAHNDEGMHKPLITLAQHHELVRIFTGKKKNQLGPRKNGNPNFPLNTITAHDTCIELKDNGKLVGFKHGNGKNPDLVYEKYRCRTCGFYITREELHLKTEQMLADFEMSDRGMKNFLDALEIVWKRKEAQAAHDAMRVQQNITNRKQLISSNALAAIDPSNASIKAEILANIEEMKGEVQELETELGTLSREIDNDRRRFMEFALKFISNLSDNFLSLTAEDRKKCKQILFPAGFRMDSDKKVYTPEISTLYRLASSKKDTEVSQKMHLVRVKRL